MKTIETIIIYNKAIPSGKALDSIDYTIKVKKVPKGIKVSSSEMNFDNEFFPCENARELIDDFLKGDSRFNENWKEGTDYIIDTSYIISIAGSKIIV